MVPPTVTSWPRPIDRTMSLAGRLTDWASACWAGTRVKGTTAQAAPSRVMARRFIGLPFFAAVQASGVIVVMDYFPTSSSVVVLPRVTRTVGAARTVRTGPLACCAGGGPNIEAAICLGVMSGLGALRR